MISSIPHGTRTDHTFIRSSEDRSPIAEKAGIVAQEKHLSMTFETGEGDIFQRGHFDFSISLRTAMEIVE